MLPNFALVLAQATHALHVLVHGRTIFLRRTAVTGLTLWVILLGVSPYKNGAQQDTHHQLLQRGEESNRFRIAAQTRHRL